MGAVDLRQSRIGVTGQTDAPQIRLDGCERGHLERG